MASDPLVQHHQRDLYSVLGVSTEASPDEIKTKYTELLLIHHPDKGGNPNHFRDLQIAYKILSDPQNRTIYTQSLAATHGDIVQDYRDPTTGELLDLGYQVCDEDFTKGETPQELTAKKELFFQKFEDSRPDAERELMTQLQQCLRPEIPLNDLVIKRQREDIGALLPIEGVMDSHGQMNTNLFNQMFEQQTRQRDLQPWGQPQPTGTTGLAPISGHMAYSLLTEDPLMTGSSVLDFQTYPAPRIETSQYDPNYIITNVRDNNPSDLAEQMETRLREHQNNRENLLQIDKSEYQIANEHDNHNHPLSHLNMLGQQFGKN